MKVEREGEHEQVRFKQGRGRRKFELSSLLIFSKPFKRSPV